MSGDLQLMRSWLNPVHFTVAANSHERRRTKKRSNDGLTPAQKRKAKREAKRRIYNKQGIKPVMIGIHITNHWLDGSLDISASEERKQYILFQAFEIEKRIGNADFKGLTGPILHERKISLRDELRESGERNAHKIEIGKKASHAFSSFIRALDLWFPWARYYIFVDPELDDLRYLTQVLRHRRPATDFTPLMRWQECPRRRHFGLYNASKILLESAGYSIAFRHPSAPLPTYIDEKKAAKQTAFHILKKQLKTQILSAIGRSRKGKTRRTTPEFVLKDKHLPFEHKSTATQKFLQMKILERRDFFQRVLAQAHSQAKQGISELRRSQKGREELERLAYAAIIASQSRCIEINSDSNSAKNLTLPRGKLSSLSGSRPGKIVAELSTQYSTKYRSPRLPKLPQKRVLLSSMLETVPQLPTGRSELTRSDDPGALELIARGSGRRRKGSKRGARVYDTYLTPQAARSSYKNSNEDQRTMPYAFDETVTRNPNLNLQPYSRPDRNLGEDARRYARLAEARY